MSTTVPINVLKCPSCGVLNDRASCEEEDAVPEEGDLTVCLYCGNMCAFTVADDGSLGLTDAPSEDTLDEYTREWLRRTREFIHEFHASRGPVGRG